MALLVEGKPLSPEEIKKFLNYIREHGITQFLNVWHNTKHLEGDNLRFGDEIECAILVMDPVNKTVKISVRSAEVYLYLFSCLYSTASCLLLEIVQSFA